VTEPILVLKRSHAKLAGELAFIQFVFQDSVHLFSLVLTPAVHASFVFFQPAINAGLTVEHVALCTLAGLPDNHCAKRADEICSAFLRMAPVLWIDLNL
jgi:hypothetical protein